MNIIIRKSNIPLYLVSLFLCAIFLVDIFFSSELAFVLFFCLALALLAKFGFKIKLQPIFLLLFFLIFLLGALIGVIEFGLARSLKDIWYFGKPCLYFLGGAFIYRIFGDAIPLVKIFIFLTVVSALIYLIPVLISFNDFFTMGPDEFRDKYGKGSILFSFGIAFYFYFLKKEMRKSFLLCLFFIVLLISLLLIQSRLSLLMLALFILAKIKSNSVHFFTTTGLFLVVIFFSVPKETLDTVVSDRQSFSSKLLSSVNELRPQNYIFARNIHTNWRGYETFVALSNFSSKSALSQIVGGGFGSTVYIDFAKRGGAGEQSDVRLYQLDWLHNGYVTILLKTGLLGLIIYIAFGFRILYLCSRYRDNSATNAVCRCLLYYFLIATFLVGGIFAKSGVMILLFALGFMIEQIKGIPYENFNGTSERRVIRVR